MVNHGNNRWQLNFEFDDFYFVKASTKKICNWNKKGIKSLLQNKEIYYMYPFQVPFRKMDKTMMLLEQRSAAPWIWFW